MPSLFLLLPISLVLVLIIGAFFWWAIFAGQFEDTQEAAHSILDDDDTSSEAMASAQHDRQDRGDHDGKPGGP